MRLLAARSEVPKELLQVGVYSVLEMLPEAVVVLDAVANIVYRNKVAVSLQQLVLERRGAAVLGGLRDEVCKAAAHGRVFPVRKVVAVVEDGQHAEAEFTVDRIGTSGYVATWRDVTDQRDTARATEAVAEELSGTAATFTRLGERLLEDSEQVSTGASSVAAGSEEMTSSIREIASSAAAAVNETATAVEAAHQAGQRLAKLADSSARISAVSNLITGIAEQTNLLALNATIEAARAGEAGKGFAVVAGEVKDLASRTSSATGEITEMIATIQRDSADAEVSIAEIERVIGEIQRQQTTVAGAVEEQTATAQEISASMAAVADAAASARTAAGELQQHAGHVADKSGQLREIVSR